MAEKTWSYKNYQIKEGLKPGSKHFQYFFMLLEKDKKKCNYCVWIDDETLTGLSHPKSLRRLSLPGERNGANGSRERSMEETSGIWC